ncbi:MAG: hypothetical protein DIZ80_16885 [endosymbiont of Galathealinum brachiosum]|uniref:CHAT domain-containing protein n=1 Tax=endosymbiont of Galathealinum brachiosum TaxID=2200906 RepID=A0A370D6Q0_9GAMM|nr:MAG: hypothetical protein DIZ80_16885 [endosymbiont of Galathealinum brachiosum]
MKRYNLLLLLILFIQTSLAFCENNIPVNITEDFNKAANHHKGMFKSLMGMRGFPSLKDRSATLDNILNKLASYEKPTTLLFYENNENELRIWTLNNNRQVNLKKIQISSSDLEQKIIGFRKTINSLSSQIDRAPKLKRGITRNAKKVNKTSLDEISQLLVPEELHKILDNTEQLLIIPSSAIGSIPFAMLDFPGKDGKQLVDSVSITILPSLFDTDNALPRRYVSTNNHNTSLIVGNPEFYNDSDWHFPQLPGAEHEARIVSKYLNSSPLTGSNANKSDVLKTIETADIIYFATHGVASVDSPLDESFIALAGTDFKSSRLTAREIQNLSLQAKLVVLSACQTGLGKTEDAGIIGLARAFKIAGAEEVLVSLWNVDDEVTTELMTSFMKTYLESTENASSALRTTMAMMRTKHKDPRLWASFTVFSGEGTVIEQTDN